MLGLEIPEAKEDWFKSPVSTDLPNANLVLTNRGFLLLSQDKFTEAVQCFTEVLNRSPDSHTAMNNLALIQL